MRPTRDDPLSILTLHDKAWVWLARIPGAILRRDTGITESIEMIHQSMEERQIMLRRELDYSPSEAQLIVNPDRSPMLPSSESMYRTD